MLTSVHGAASQEVSSAVTKSHESILQEFLVQFNKVSARGFVKTLRPVDTDVGYTLETLLEIPENNSPRGDFPGMEIKAYRDSETEFDDQDKMNLVLKEPEWLDGLTTAERNQQYGYKNSNRRQAWYLSVISRKNAANLQLVVTEQGEVLELHRNDVSILQWSLEVLEQRLQEKHAHSLFIGAESRGKGADAEFWHKTVTWCQEPSAKRLLELAASGDIIVELRRHLHPDGSAHNHGTAFRIRKHRLQTLFREQKPVRPVSDDKKQQSDPGMINYRPRRRASTAFRVGIAGCAPCLVVAKAPAAAAKRVASETDICSARAIPKAAAKASPAAVVSTASTLNGGTCSEVFPSNTTTP